MSYRLRAVTSILFLPLVSLSQLHWHKVDSLYSVLPASLHIYKTTDSFNGRPFIAYYASAKLKDKKLLFTTQVGNGYRYTPLEFYSQESNPLVVV
ncbi:MAG TPA: hypothetical protein VNV85_11410, partial [Puia sp.]|nr:hypothetical protein [Puia sp.]